MLSALVPAATIVSKWNWKETKTRDAGSSQRGTVEV